MARPITPANSHGKVTVTPYYLDDGVERPVPKHMRAVWPKSEITRYQVRTYARLQDRTQRDPDTGAYLPGPRVEIKFWTRSDDPVRVHTRVKDELHKRQLKLIEEQQEHERRHRKQAEAARDERLVGALITAVFEERAASGEFAASTLTSYRSAYGRLVESGITDLDIGDLTPATVSDALAKIMALAKTNSRQKATQAGTSAAKTARSVLVLGVKRAISRGFIDRNPVPDAEEIRRPRRRSTDPVEGRDTSRAFTREERLKLALTVARDERAVRLDLRDMVLAGIAIGGREGEVAAIRWCDVRLDRSEGALSAEVTLSGTIARHKGRGLQRDVPKTPTSHRTIPLPRRVAALLARRARNAQVDLEAMHLDQRPVFPAPGRWESPAERTKWRDSSNTQKEIRRLLDLAGLPWATWHTLRRSAITTLADRLPIRMVADYAGHRSIRTTVDNYLARGEVDPTVAELL